MIRAVRRFYRLPALVFWLVWQGIYSLPIRYGWERSAAVKRMARQIRVWGRGLLRILGIKLVLHGDPSGYETTGGLVVANHQGYYDVPVHASVFGMRFAPKSELRSWPFFGWYTGMTLPIWVDRTRKQESGKILEEFRETLRENIPLIVYPEGTTTDGRSNLLPFKATPFETVVGTDIPIQPILSVFRYSDKDTNPAWYGDLKFLSHLWSLLGNGTVEAHVYILPPIYPENLDRKQLAEKIHNIMQNEYQSALRALTGKDLS